MGHRHVDVLDVTDQHFGFSAAYLSAEIAGQAFFEVFRFTYIDHRACRVIHTVDAGLTGHGAEKGFGIENVTHY